MLKQWADLIDSIIHISFGAPSDNLIKNLYRHAVWLTLIVINVISKIAYEDEIVVALLTIS